MASEEEEKAKVDKDLLEICDLSIDGLCIERKWGSCPYPTSEWGDTPKMCGLCIVRYITEKLSYHK